MYCTRDLSTHLAMADLLYALGQMGVSLCDLSPDHQQRLKASICRYLPRAAQRGRAWRGLYGLSQMGIRWQHANVKLRNALEGMYQHTHPIITLF